MNSIYNEPLINKIDSSDFKDNKKRTILIGSSESRRKFNQFSNNKITSTKYNLISWLPVSLIMQFKRVANIYFLIISILNFFYFSPKNPVSMVITFGIILMFTSIREGVEDFQRHKKDKKYNEKKYIYYNDKNKDTKGFEYKASKKIHVGEIMKIFKEEEFPADLYLLKSSNRNGICFVDTVSLDGESDLKDKKCNQYTQMMNDIDLCNMISILKCEKPNQDLDYWEGYMTILRDNEEDLKISLNNDQLLLKGSNLKNTDYVLGVVVYTGYETKIMKNGKVPNSKVSKFMKTINKILYAVMLAQTCLCFILAYFSLKWQKNHIGEFNNIIIRESNDFYEYIARVGTFLISYSQLIPISMYISVELLKLSQSSLIKYDPNLFDKETKKSALARTSELPDELGQIDFLFTDKTGTITKNNMILEKISIDDKIYTKEEMFSYFDLKYKFNMFNSNINFSKENINSLMSKENNKNLEEEEEINFKSSIVEENLPLSMINDENKIIDFLRLVCICNSIVIDYSKSIDQNLVYQSMSVDELALLNGSINSGIILKDKTITKIEINFFHKYTEIWEILAILPFASERKRMTIIAKSNEGKIQLFTKGADEVIFSKMSENLSQLAIELDNELSLEFKVKPCSNKLEDFDFSNLPKLNNIHKAKEINDTFARQGYRTLIMGKKEISEDYFINWFYSYNQILNNMDLDQFEKYNLLEDIFQQIEIGMSYIGCSAIVDKLQDEVEETINLLKKAQIKIWMLTGDKVENSIEIAKSCKLLNQESIIYFTARNIINFEEFENKIKNCNLSPFKPNVLNYNNDNNDIEMNSNSNFCIVLDGKTLSYYENLKNAEKNKFLEIILNCNSAICCRLTPKQKSQIVLIIKKSADKIILSIGDGANDVPMILESNVGIGLLGKEGTQAVRSADYSISQFKHLKDLILFHGRLSYKRMSSLTCYAFYKNIIVVFAEIYFIIFNGFSGQIFFSDWFTNFYNTFWSGWPVLVNYSIDRDLDRDLCFKYPKLYVAGQNGKYFNKKIFWSWIGFAMFHGAIIFWVPMITNHFPCDGKPKDHWHTSSLSFSVLINVVLIKLFIMTEYWNYLSLLSAFCCIFCYYSCVYIFSIGKIACTLETKIPNFIFEIFINFKSLCFIFFLPLIALIPDLTFKFISKISLLDSVDVIKKIEERND